VKIVVSKKAETETIEISLPIYRRIISDGDNYYVEHFYRVDEHKEIELTKHHYRDEWEIKTDVPNFGNHESADFLLGKGDYALTAEEFSEAMKEFREFVANIEK
jgi:hypothetical protein